MDAPLAPALVVSVPDLSQHGIERTIGWLADNYSSRVVRQWQTMPGDGMAHPVVFEIASSQILGERTFWQIVADLMPEPLELLSRYITAVVEHTAGKDEVVPFADQYSLAGQEALYALADRWLYPSASANQDVDLLGPFADIFVTWLSVSDLGFEQKQDRYIRRLFTLLRRHDEPERLARLLQLRLFRGQPHNSNPTEILRSTPTVFKMVLDGLIAEELGHPSPYSPPYPDTYNARPTTAGQDWRYEALIEGVYCSDLSAAGEALDYIESKVGARPGRTEDQ